MNPNITIPTIEDVSSNINKYIKEMKKYNNFFTPSSIVKEKRKGA